MLQWILSYASNVRIVGGCVLAKLRGRGGVATSFLAQIEDTASLPAALLGASGFGSIYSEGNTLSFEFEGAQFTVQNLLPGDFERKLASLASSQKVNFTHQALVYDPSTKALRDPFHASTGDVLKLLSRGGSLPQAFDIALAGLVERARLELREGADFLRFKARILRAAPGRGIRAAQVTNILLQHLAPLAGALPDADLAALLKSPLIRASFASFLGLDMDQVIAQVQLLRESSAAGGPDAAAWLASILAPQIQQGFGDAWIRSSDRFDHLLSRSALLEATELVTGRRSGS